MVCVLLLNLAGSAMRDVVDPRARSLSELRRLRARGVAR
jgi:peptide/nickel transport system permease protein